jgi:hypothetical protein
MVPEGPTVGSTVLQAVEQALRMRAVGRAVVVVDTPGSPEPDDTAHGATIPDPSPKSTLRG